MSCGARARRRWSCCTGSGSSADDWMLQLPAFAPHYLCVPLDLRGHGTSDKPPGRYSVALFAADVAASAGSVEAGAGPYPRDQPGRTGGAAVGDGPRGHRAQSGADQHLPRTLAAARGGVQHAAATPRHAVASTRHGCGRGRSGGRALPIAQPGAAQGVDRAPDRRQ